jgi:hypothetical protein
MEKIFEGRNKSHLQCGNFLQLRESSELKLLKQKKKTRLAFLSENRKKLKQEHDSLMQSLTLSHSFSLIFSDDEKSQTEGAHNLRLILSQNYTVPFQELVDSGVIPVLINFTSNFSCPGLQYEAAWSLSNIASGDAEHSKILVDRGIVPKIVDLLQSPFEHIKDQGVWVIGNLTGDSSSYSELICRYGTVQKLIEIIQTCTSNYLLQSAVWALGNLCKGEKAPEFKVIKNAVSVFCKLLLKNDESIIKESLWVLASITEYSEESCDVLILNEVIPRIISFFSSKDIDLQLPAITIIGRVAAGSDIQTSEVINSGAIQALTQLINSPNREIRKEAIWCLSNFAAGNEEHIESLVRAEIFQKMMKIIYRDEKYVKVEALWVVANAAGKGSKKQINELVKAGAISTLIHCLNSEDYKVLQVVMLGIKGILAAGNQILTESGSNPYAVIFEESDGLRLLHKLQFKENNKIYEDAYFILTSYFEGDELELFQMIDF